MRRPLAAALTGAAVALVAVPTFVAGAATSNATTSQMSVIMDWVPNPDHVGLYYAQQKGLFAKQGVSVSLKAPSDASAPLKLVGAGTFDLAISYEPEFFFAAAKKLPVTAVAAIVPVPLNSLISMKKAGITAPAELRGKSIGIAGLPFDTAVITTMRNFAKLGSGDVKSVNVGFNLVPALLSGKVDAIVGGYRNVEALQIGQETGSSPNVVPLNKVGIPNYDELVLAANSKRLKSDPTYAANVKKVIAGLIAGTKAALKDPSGSVAIIKDVSDYKDDLINASVPATLKLIQSGGPKIGCLYQSQWQAFSNWMLKTKLITGKVPASAVMTTKYLPTRC
jgi:putative hydroxymethylpyrimidine transport system substrate-binding protein